MTTEERVRKTISGTISDISFKMDKNDNEYAQVKLLEPGRDYPTSCSAFADGDDDTIVQRFKKAKKGTLIGLVIEESPGTYQGKAIIYRNIKDIVAAEPGGTAPSRPVATTAAPANVQPTIDRQDQIMLQNASSWIGPMYLEWVKATDNAQSFEHMLEDVAIHATWYLENVYQKGGYYPAPDQDDPDSPF